MDEKYNFKKSIGEQRVGIISALVALSVAMLAILHNGKMTILGLEVQFGSFVEAIINALKLFLCASIVSGTTFLLTVGYLCGFNYDEKYKSDIRVVERLVAKWHVFIFWLHKKSYGFTIEIFVLAFMSITFNLIAKLFGFYGDGSIIVASVIVAIAIITILIVALCKKCK